MFSSEFYRIASSTSSVQLFDFVRTGIAQDPVSGQEFAEILPTVSSETAKASWYFIGDDSDRGFKFKIQSRLKGQFVLGALYYDSANKPGDYQYGITETAKDGESRLDCAKRGLIEETGLEFVGTPTPDKIHISTTKSGKVRHCNTYIVHASRVRAASVTSCQPHHAMMMAADPTSGPEHKAQVLVYGTRVELETLVASITHKPVKPISHEYYDKEVKGIAILPA